MKETFEDWRDWVYTLIPNDKLQMYNEYILSDERNDDLWSMFKVGLSPLEATKAIIKMIDELWNC